ncbi:MAG: HAD-IB family hydrolase [Nevskiales bacterium]|nr:HAD-IB family hydrolase [Nevskiales bacterium]
MGTLALFDLDGTLLPLPSSERRFLRHLFNTGRLGFRQGLTAAGFVLRRATVYGRHVWKKNKAYLCGLSVTDVEALGADFARRQLLPLLRPAPLARLRAHQADGATVVLLTGAPQFIAGPIAEALRCTRGIATQPAQRDGRYTAEPPLRHPLGMEKLRLAQTLSQKLGLSLTGAWAYGDAHDDLPLLESVGHAVAVSPDARLRAQARRLNWEIV